MVVLTSFSPPTEGIKHEQPSTSLVLNGREVGTGTLYIAESKLSWRNDASGEGFSLLYPHIAVHGVSRDIQQFGCECLFIMIDSSLEEIDVNEDSEDNDDDSGGTTEMRFSPEDKGQLDAMYRAMIFCQSLHRDSDEQQLSEDEEYLDADGEEEEFSLAGGDTGYIDGHPNVEQSNGWGNTEEDMETDGQFEDAQDED